MDKLGLSSRRMQQIAASENMRQLLVAEAPDLKPVVEYMKERVTREVIAVPPERRVEVLRSAVSTPGRITARKIKLLRIIEQTPESMSSQPCCPTCHRPL